jgi:hypothetical protein
VSYREFDTAAGAFIFPTTTPTQFDPAQLHDSVERIVQLKPAAVYVTHFGRVSGVGRLSADLHADIDAFVAIATQERDTRDRAAAIARRLRDHLDKRLDRHGARATADTRRRVLALDIDLNAAGLDAWLARCAA